MLCFFFFFFQAEDGIRDYKVTGVQTCALPIYQEIKEGRGCGPNKDYILMKLDHLGADTIRKRLPSVEEIGHNFANVDITKEPIPVVPTIHYQMGGIPTNINGQVVVWDGQQNNVVNGQIGR